MRRRLTHSHRPPPIPKSPHGDAAGDIFFRKARTPPPPSPNSVEAKIVQPKRRQQQQQQQRRPLRRYHLAKDQRIGGGQQQLAPARSAAASAPFPPPKALFSPPKVITNDRSIDRLIGHITDAATLGPPGAISPRRIRRSSSSSNTTFSIVNDTMQYLDHHHQHQINEIKHPHHQKFNDTKQYIDDHHHLLLLQRATNDNILSSPSPSLPRRHYHDDEQHQQQHRGSVASSVAALATVLAAAPTSLRNNNNSNNNEQSRRSRQRPLAQAVACHPHCLRQSRSVPGSGGGWASQPGSPMLVDRPLPPLFSAGSCSPLPTTNNHQLNHHHHREHVQQYHRRHDAAVLSEPNVSRSAKQQQPPLMPFLRSLRQLKLFKRRSVSELSLVLELLRGGGTIFGGRAENDDGASDGYSSTHGAEDEELELDDNELSSQHHHHRFRHHTASPMPASGVRTASARDRPSHCDNADAPHHAAQSAAPDAAPLSVGALFARRHSAPICARLGEGGKMPKKIPGTKFA
uniref:Uncharacterized protein n=1 Tax=Globodera rostochiensis TaxID=31243 RepID=A0A914HLT0_GLORO